VNTLPEQFTRVRELTLKLCESLQPEDTVVQSMPDVSPTKWHLAHVTWFFERLVLEEFVSGYQRFNEQYNFLFNSYYYSVGQMHARPKRGMLTRPTLADIVAYRSHVDNAMLELLNKRGDKPEIQQRVTLGLNHEQQHQELLLTDIKHVFSCNPMLPVVNADLVVPESIAPAAYSFVNGQSGITQAGAADVVFYFDHRPPPHDGLFAGH